MGHKREFTRLMGQSRGRLCQIWRLQVWGSTCACASLKSVRECGKEGHFGWFSQLHRTAWGLRNGFTPVVKIAFRSRVRVRHLVVTVRVWLAMSVQVLTKIEGCVCVRERERDWGRIHLRIKSRKSHMRIETCTFSTSSKAAPQLRKMQVVSQDVLVSSKPDKSNLVLSGSATISWLFGTSGPCSSDLW